MTAAPADPRADVLVTGGGLTGLAMACALGSIGAEAVLVERRPLGALVEGGYDGRVTAVARAGQTFLERIGVWRHLDGAAEPILDIVVGEAGGKARVHYEDTRSEGSPLGWIVENRELRLALMRRLDELGSIRLAAPARMEELNLAARGVTARLADGRFIRASLVTACEGRHSSTREAAAIGVRVWSYAQSGIVCSFTHPVPHGGRAVERFFPDGPFAILPQTASTDRRPRSSIVWALAEPAAGAIAALDDAAFAAEAQERVGPKLGTLELASRRWCYPLSLAWADSYVGPRLMLVGDTARAIHPIAGQGWNLALRDVAAITEIVEDQLKVGLDAGDGLALERYSAWRSFDSLALIAATDGLNRLFANDRWPLRIARDLGLGAVERLPPIKRFFMRHAMGLVGDLPRLMRAP